MCLYECTPVSVRVRAVCLYEYTPCVYTSARRVCFRLVIKSNEIASAGLCAISDCMRRNITLEGVYIWGNRIEESAWIVSLTTCLAV